MDSQRSGSSVQVVLLAIVIVAAVVGGIWSIQAIQFSVTASEFLDKMLPLLLVSLLIERTLEVFIATWRGPATDARDAAVQRALQAAQAPNVAPPAKPLQEEIDRDKYRADTRRIALTAGVCLGVVVSAVGIRALGQFAMPGALDALRSSHPTQASVFTALDIVLTGAVVGGGSDGLHKIISAFTSVADATTEKAKGTT